MTPSRPEALSRLAGQLLRQGGSSESHFNLARACAESRLFVTARDLLVKLLEIEPHHRHAGGVLRDVYMSAPEQMEANSRVHCPCCGGHLPSFIPGGVRLRPRARCPLCGSLERHRLLALFLQERLTKGSRLLHIAPEICLRPLIDSMQIEAVRGDLEPKHDQIRVDITDIQFPDGYFDTILCNHVLEHVPDDASAMRELCRVLKPKGWAVLQVPLDRNRDRTYEDPTITSPEERTRAFGQHDHVRWYGLDYPERLRDAGFLVHPIDFTGSVGADAVATYGLDAHETLYYCIKE